MIPDPDNPQTWTTITNIPILKQHLMNYSQTHFKQAKGTPYTTTPMQTLLGHNGLTQSVQQIYNWEDPDQTLLINPATWCSLNIKYACLPPRQPQTSPTFWTINARLPKMAWTNGHITIWQAPGDLQIAFPRHKQRKIRQTNTHQRHRHYARHLLPTGPGSQTHPHLHLVANHMEYVSQKRSWVTTNQKTPHPIPHQSQPELTLEMVLFHGVH